MQNRAHPGADNAAAMATARVVRAKTPFKKKTLAKFIGNSS
jgi:hypothetical protein